MITDVTPVRIGDTDLFAPRVGLGTAALGNFLQAMSDADAVAVISRALTSGVRYIDTAPLYGHGLAEQRVGLAIARARRAELLVSTKVGRLLSEGAPRDDTQYHDGISFYKDVIDANGPRLRPRARPLSGDGGRDGRSNGPFDKTMSVTLNLDFDCASGRRRGRARGGFPRCTPAGASGGR
jgi:hypothetical protein